MAQLWLERWNKEETLEKGRILFESMIKLPGDSNSQSLTTVSVALLHPSHVEAAIAAAEEIQT